LDVVHRIDVIKEPPMPATAARPRRSARKPERPDVADRLNRIWSRPGVKIGAWIVFTLVWIPFLAALSMVIGINPIFNRQVEKLGEKALRVPVRLHRASVSFAGRLSLGRFTIANPPGFAEEDGRLLRRALRRGAPPQLFRQELDIPVLTSSTRSSISSSATTASPATGRS
jgi:hypothetical protein